MSLSRVYVRQTPGRPYTTGRFARGLAWATDAVGPVPPLVVQQEDSPGCFVVFDYVLAHLSRGDEPGSVRPVEVPLDAWPLLLDMATPADALVIGRNARWGAAPPGVAEQALERAFRSSDTQARPQAALLLAASVHDGPSRSRIPELCQVAIGSGNPIWKVEGLWRLGDYLAANHGLMAKAEQAFRDALKVPVPAGSGWVYYDDYRGEAQKRLRMLLEQQGKPVLAEDLYPWLYVRHDDEKHGPFAVYGDADSSLAAHVIGTIQAFRAHLDAEGIRADVPPPSIFIDARKRLSRVPWNFGGGPLIIRLPSDPHSGLRR
jgi:hypothetical protein